MRVVRLMLTHGRVVVTMRGDKDKKRRSVPSERDRWCADPVNEKLTERVNLAVVAIVMTCGASLSGRVKLASRFGRLSRRVSADRRAWLLEVSGPSATAGSFGERPKARGPRDRERIFAIAHSDVNYVPFVHKVRVLDDGSAGTRTSRAVLGPSYCFADVTAYTKERPPALPQAAKV